MKNQKVLMDSHKQSLHYFRITTTFLKHNCLRLNDLLQQWIQELLRDVCAMLGHITLPTEHGSTSNNLLLTLKGLPHI